MSVRIAGPGSVALRVAEERHLLAKHWVRGRMAELHLLTHDLDEAEAAISESHIGLLPSPLQSNASVLISLDRGRIALARGDHRRAAQIAEDVVGFLRRIEVRQFVEDALLLKGMSLAAGGQGGEAEGVLRDARSEAESLRARRILWEILWELSEVVTAQGNIVEATELRTAAGRVIDQIAESIDAAKLRASFVARPEVRALSSGGR
jgi:hypothetical protein